MNLDLRALTHDDAPALAAPFQELGWPGKTAEQLAAYAEQQRSGERDVVVAWLGKEPAGYGCVVRRSGYPPFREGDIPEIQDLNVLPAHRRRGVGSALLDRLEELVAVRHPVVGLGVGVYADYGPAMRLYVARGYQFDGRGLMSGGRPVAPGSRIRVDDDVTLMLTKRVRS